LKFPSPPFGDLRFLVVCAPPSAPLLKISSTPSSQPHMGNFYPNSMLAGYRSTDLWKIRCHWPFPVTFRLFYRLLASFRTHFCLFSSNFSAFFGDFSVRLLRRLLSFFPSTRLHLVLNIVFTVSFLLGFIPYLNYSRVS